jgi:hypothetical protein
MENTMSFERFKAEYPALLAQAMADHPDEYMKAPGADVVAQRMLAAIEAKGIGAVNIDSRSFRTAAKKFGIKNTYKAWRAFFGQTG